MSAPRIAVMTPADLDRALDWAAAEGWNPGIDDAQAFRAADPEGFLMAFMGEEPVAAISVVRQGADFGFLGLYLCVPAWRGRGLGWKIWQAGLARLAGRVVGLDAVPAQEANYARSGFAVADRARRWGGVVAGEAAGGGAAPARPEDLAELLAWDRAASGIDRAAYLGAWLAPAPTRITLVLRAPDGRLRGFGTIRACRAGAKVGPLMAEDADAAERLLRALAATPPGPELVVDMPASNPEAERLARRLGLRPDFDTARMYLGPAPREETARVFGRATLELG
ncbi:GNAT family N-acetyltransferase [Amaricoccus solimangrovi]|uniref:GNAT family N-acetyltransferase n=1 Tax=Amaricoccus solimangrovi TaxID=2589815 RepID=A0A501WNR2_9RHOB|nr:GNAT family N-acetyltransferase [Amaricoccus solimangrovi]TPE51373.1 GNAT family N-acetyltransferase [Amaricoccus solimangrovi]